MKTLEPEKTSPPPHVPLTPEDCEAARCWAKTMRKHKKVTYKIDPNQSDETISFQGACGEIGTCKYLKQTWAPEIYVGGDAGYDLLLTDLRIEVKTTVNQEGNLLITPDRDKKDPDVLVFGILDGGGVRLMGWVSWRRFEKQRGLCDPGHGERWIMSPGRLVHMRDLRAIIERLTDAAEGRKVLS